jgi:hypothetical protein
VHEHIVRLQRWRQGKATADPSAAPQDDIHD